MRSLLMPSVALLIATAGVVGAAEVKSGLEPGARAGAYNVTDITGPNSGKSLCYK